MKFNNEEIRYQSTPVRNKPWPIKLIMRLGIKNERQAKLIVITVSVILILITLVIYKNTFFTTPKTEVDINNLPPEIQAQIKAAANKY